MKMAADVVEDAVPAEAGEAEVLIVGSGKAPAIAGGDHTRGRVMAQLTVRMIRT